MQVKHKPSVLPPKEDQFNNIYETYENAKKLFDDGRILLSKFTDRLDGDSDIKSFANTLPSLLSSVSSSLMDVFKIQQFLLHVSGVDISEGETGLKKASKIANISNVSNINDAIKNRQKHIEHLSHKKAVQ